ncbi:CU044_5270 family protein [Streptomyces sp. ISL-36]|uniref:CU044_5270 family protein n=1 Tax=Streptomyces sp. ISL-36 TaxID=2819182 RepID=UPI001BE6BC6A|nr:CU044_5270 family protein [Streptomyces sp. ISL-36]MBT2440161.1 CU044_5270 family protein [Streptomyces sp. ISL-36]
MNVHRSEHRPVGSRQSEDLPTFEERDLPAGRHQFHKERLMSQIHHDRLADAAARSPRNPFFRKAVLVPAAAALVGALAIGVLALTPGDAVDAGSDRATGPVLTTEIGAADPQGAPRLLDRISLAAAGTQAPRPSTGQYIYIETKSANTYVRTVGDKASLVSEPLHTRRSWRSPDGLKGWLIEPGTTGPEGITLEGTDEKGNVPTPHLGAPSHNYLAALPTDPDALLRKIYKETEGQGNGPDQQAFTTIGDLLIESWPSPRLSAALYKAAAKIPGVVMVNDATDAAGRRGVAVARLDETSGQRTEWIFDSKTLTFLGERTVQVREAADNGVLIKPGTVVFTHAIINRAFVDDIKQLPVRNG